MNIDKLKERENERMKYFIGLCDYGWFVFTIDTINNIDKKFVTCVGIDKETYENLYDKQFEQLRN